MEISIKPFAAFLNLNSLIDAFTVYQSNMYEGTNTNRQQIIFGFKIIFYSQKMLQEYIYYIKLWHFFELPEDVSIRNNIIL